MEHQNPALIDAFGNAIKTRSLIQEITADNVSSVSFTNLTSDFKRYIIEVDKVAPQTDSVDMFVRFSTSGVFRAGASDYSWTLVDFRSNAGLVTTVDNTDSEIHINRPVASTRFGTSANEHFDLTLTITSLGSISEYPKIGWDSWGNNDANILQYNIGTGIYRGLTSGLNTIDGVQLFFSSGLVREGTFRLYGQE